jgi:uncharacterized protein YjbJ (UPF0337 family)
MSAEDKVKNTAETAKGKVKEGVGRTTGNKSLEAEGHGDQAKGDLKQAGAPPRGPAVRHPPRRGPVPAQQLQAPSRETAHARGTPCLLALEPS